MTNNRGIISTGSIADKLKIAFIGKKDEAPEFLLDNEYIEDGYRIDHDSCCKATKSLFTCHNESVNIWSHLMGSLVMLTFFVILWVILMPERFEVGKQYLESYKISGLQL